MNRIGLFAHPLRQRKFGALATAQQPVIMKRLRGAQHDVAVDIMRAHGWWTRTGTGLEGEMSS